MKSKQFLCILVMSIALMITAFLSSCGNYVVISGVHMKDDSVIEIAAGDFSYEGKKLIVVLAGGEEREVDLTEDMIPEVERLKFFKMGEHEVQVVFRDRFTTTMKIKVSRHDFDDIYKLEGYTCTYDGKPHRVDLNYQLPEGATIDYIYGNNFTNAGVYDVVGVISKNGYNSKTLSTKLIIEKTEYDTSDIKFEDSTVAYDGETKSITATGVPSGVSVVYDIYNDDGSARINNAVNAGTYKVVAKFTSGDNNHKQIEDMEATLTIEKAEYDMSNVTLADVTKTYDGQSYDAKLATGSQLPEGVTVSFEYYNSEGVKVATNENSGEYKIVAKFKGNTTNYKDIPDMEAKLTVEKKLVSISHITLDSKTVNYDRLPHSLEITGELPQGVTCTYVNNNQTYAGEYTVDAQFAPESPNVRLDVTSLTAYLIINQIIENVKIIDEATEQERDITGDDIYFEMDGETKVVKIKGLDSKYTIYSEKFYDDNGTLTDITALENGKNYSYSIDINYADQNEKNSVMISPISGTLTYTEA